MTRKPRNTKNRARSPQKRGKKVSSTRRTKGKTKPKQPTPTRTSIRLAIIKGLAIFAVVGAIYALWEWKQIEKRVVTSLRGEHTTNIPTIYSAPFNLTSFVRRSNSLTPSLRDTAIREALVTHGYFESSQPPSRSGEFHLSEASLSIITREHFDVYGRRMTAALRNLELSRLNNNEEVLLEPQVVSLIGSDNMRATSRVALGRIPKFAQQAVIAIEDERFYDHIGIDFISIARAAVTNLVSLGFVQGGSTLTQQLAKNLFLSPKKTIRRKLKEVPTALSIERYLTKDQILELYLNEVYLGQEGSVAIHGIPSASKSFFGKTLDALEIHEAALLAGIIKAPSFYNPRKSPARAKNRRNVVLRKMADQGYITPSQLHRALAKSIATVAPKHRRRVAPFFSTAVEQELSTVLDLQGVASTGLTVMTGLDLDIQRCASKAIAAGLKRLEQNKPSLRRKSQPLQGALVAIEPFSGLVKAWVGGRNFGLSQFDRVAQASRQIGSTIKPFVYLTALDGSLNSYKVATAGSIIEDEPITFNLSNRTTWSPENYDHNYRGDVTLRYALERSLNLPALYIAQRVGIPAIRRLALNVKLADSIQPLPSLALGALDTTLLRLTGAYAALANGGIYVNPRLFIAASDDQGEPLVIPDISEQRIAEEGPTFVLTNILQGVIDRGTASSIRRLGYNGQAAGKTGTSDESRDAWFVGYSPNLAVGIWIGYDDNKPTGLSGGSAAAPIWGEFMSCGAAFTDNDSFIPPRSVGFYDIDTSTGGRASPNCPVDRISNEVFVRGTEPRDCSVHPYRDDSQREGQERGFWSRFLP